MNTEYFTGAEWRKWDLHLHTKDTVKNDQFISSDFEVFCNTLFKKALECKVAVLGITDYFNIKNYLRVKEFILKIEENTFFTTEESIKIRDILILPNVELRVLPVTDRGKLVNMHCIFNPEYVDKLEDDFFSKLTMSVGVETFSMNETGIKRLGLSKGGNAENSYIKGIESFVVSHEKLIELFKAMPNLRRNTITVVSNSNSDGVSAFQKHYDLFEDVDKTSLDEVRKAIYHMSDLIFSGNPNDRQYFLGIKKNKDGIIIDDKDSITVKCGSLKGCVVGCDAHTEEALFAPAENRICWIKADPSFDGLKQVLIEPEERIFIGEIPPLLQRIQHNRTKYIKALRLNPISNYDGKYGKWFDNIEIPLNPELVAIIGNKGSGKSAIADIIALCSNYKNQRDFSFLHKNKFRDGKHAKNFEAHLIWESDIESSKNLADDSDNGQIELVKYMPQGHFERLTNEISSVDEFQKEIENVVFTHLEDEKKIGYNTFDELIDAKKKNVDRSINSLIEEIEVINESIVKLDSKRNPKYKAEIEGKIALKNNELLALVEPPIVIDPNQDPIVAAQNKIVIEKIEKLKTEIQTAEKEIEGNQGIKSSLILDLREIKEFKTELQFKVKEFSEFQESKANLLKVLNLTFSELLKIEINVTKLDELITLKESELNGVKIQLGEEKSDDINFKPLPIQLTELTIQLREEQNKLDGQQKLYQRYLSEKKEWETRKESIIGDSFKRETLKYYESELKYLHDKLNEEINLQNEKRKNIAIQIFDKKQEIVEIYKEIKGKIDSIINENSELLLEYKINIDASLSLQTDFRDHFLGSILQNKTGTFFNKENGLAELNKLISGIDFDKREEVVLFLDRIVDSLCNDQRQEFNGIERFLEDQIKEPKTLLKYLFSLDFLGYNYQLKQANKSIEQLSPGEKGALLLVFYLLLDNNDIPLIIDQPEDNLDNNSVAHILVPFIRKAKIKRQIILVTHNPNLAIVSDAEQVIYVNIDKENDHDFTFTSGSIEDRKVNDCIVNVLEGAMPAFNKRKQKYY